MTDLERRLRAALRGASEPAPAGLFAAVMRRHRRHQIRVGASVLAVVVGAALAVAPVNAALRTGHKADGARTSHGSAPPSERGRRAAAATGTVLSGCKGSNSGAIGRNWRSEAWHVAGPLWFIEGGHSSERIRLYVAIAVLHAMGPGSVVVIKPAPQAGLYLRFLYGPKDYLTPGTRYTMRSGERGVTFESCRPDQQIVPFPGVTDYYGGYLIRGKRCVPVRVWAPDLKQPVTIRLGACPRH